MSKRTFRIREGEPLLDVQSYGRGGPGGPGGRLTPAQVEQIRRTVRRTPEAVVKILPRASNDLKAVGKHLDYIGRNGELELETDDGEQLSGRIGKDLLDDWDLDLDDVRRQANLAATIGRKPPKLVHKLMFSMPPGTSPEKVLGAVRNFAREEFWGQSFQLLRSVYFKGMRSVRPIAMTGRRNYRKVAFDCGCAGAL